ncbi:ABC transporter substrate-binding protein [Actinomyces bowdenii]|uniref:ABC transporter substrate-binding protein n=1 Tax=Actinomyces bowdenii TaxID=131109 RepID=A0A853ELS7_9ACTO|nr:ABC transporter substrate-binding protein [Actinomyces bowdenii]MBF0697652.1 ABC transporter substrate-binding protein [Actinomyces bowdenii]NYS69825.1 ABC transporter substrate-binding protein [Actinomyces bowdenii]
MRRRDILALAGRLGSASAVVALGGYGAWRSVAPPQQGAGSLLGRPLRVGYLPITDASALLIAHERGLWAAAGVASAPPVLFRSWDALGQAILVGEVDVVHMLMPMALQFRFAASAPIRVIAWGHTNGSCMVTAGSEPSTGAHPQAQAAGLAGGRLAVPYWWSIHSVITQRLLGSWGLRPVIGTTAGPQEVELVVMPPAEMVSGLASGAIAGFTVADPFGAVAEIQGVGHVSRLLGDVWRDHACCGLVVRQDLIDSSPRAVQAVVDGLIAAQAWLEDNRGRAASVLTSAGYLPQARPAVERALERPAPAWAGHPDWHGQRLGFSAFPHESYTTTLVDLLGQTAVDGDRSFLEGLDPARAHRELVDDAFVRAALERAGTPVPHRTEEVGP